MGVRMSLCRSFSAPLGLSFAPLLVLHCLTKNVLPLSFRLAPPLRHSARQQRATGVRMSLHRSFSAPLGLSHAPLLLSIDSRRTFFHSLFGSHLRCDTPLRCTRCDTQASQVILQQQAHENGSNKLRRTFFHCLFAPPLLRYSSIVRYAPSLH